MAAQVFTCILLLASLVHFGYGLKSRSDCELPKYKGLCGGNYPSYYFDMHTRECKPFIWSGCGGNGNRFYSIDECEFACSYYMKLDRA